MREFSLVLNSFIGKPHIITSCGVEGFKTAKKGTNIAAQSTGISISTVSIRGYYNLILIKFNTHIQQAHENELI